MCSNADFHLMFGSRSDGRVISSINNIVGRHEIDSSPNSSLKDSITGIKKLIMDVEV